MGRSKHQARKLLDAAMDVATKYRLSRWGVEADSVAFEIAERRAFIQHVKETGFWNTFPGNCYAQSIEEVEKATHELYMTGLREAGKSGAQRFLRDITKAEERVAEMLKAREPADPLMQSVHGTYLLLTGGSIVNADGSISYKRQPTAAELVRCLNEPGAIYDRSQDAMATREKSVAPKRVRKICKLLHLPLAAGARGRPRK